MIPMKNLRSTEGTIFLSISRSKFVVIVEPLKIFKVVFYIAVYISKGDNI